MIVCNLTPSLIEKYRLIFFCFEKAFSGETRWAKKPKYFILTFFLAVQIINAIYTFQSCLLTMDNSSNTIELLNNSLAAMVLEQLEIIGSGPIFSIFKSRNNKITQRKEFMIYKASAGLEKIVLAQVFIVVILQLLSMVAVDYDLMSF